MRYIDLFSGCGGLSLGLKNAGFEGVFAVEKSPDAFGTFQHNLLRGEDTHFDWPRWLPKQNLGIEELLENFSKEIRGLRGYVDAVVGGPPCQGFSLAGRRNRDDPRNKLSELYIQTVDLVRPKYLLFENVKGFNTKFKKADGTVDKLSYAERVKSRLEQLGYRIFSSLVNSADYGVPQVRQRYILVGVSEQHIGDSTINPFDILNEIREGFLQTKGLPLTPITVNDAISDLATTNGQLIPHSGGEKSKFLKLAYTEPANVNNYLRLMRSNFSGAPNSMRLARHKNSTKEKFLKIQRIVSPGKSLTDEHKLELGMKKQVLTVLDRRQASRTVTTLPDDLLHYSEPRILTVRENARLQSFPDWFEFRGKYTTGGNRRAVECPRYTQVGNAVPPLLGEALGNMLLSLENGLLD